MRARGDDGAQVHEGGRSSSGVGRYYARGELGPGEKKRKKKKSRRGESAFGRFLARALVSVSWLASLGALSYLGVALATYSPQDPGFSVSVESSTVENWLGEPGAWVANALLYMFGLSSWWIVAAGFFCLLTVAFNPREPGGIFSSRGFASALISIVSFSCLMLGSSCLERFLTMDIYGFLPAGPGGILGHYFCSGPVRMLGAYPAIGLFLLMTVIGISLVFRFSWIFICEKIGDAALFLVRLLIGTRRTGGEAAPEAAEASTSFTDGIGSRGGQKNARRPEGLGARIARQAKEKLGKGSSAAASPAKSAAGPGPGGAMYQLSLLEPADNVDAPVDEEALGLTSRLIEAKLKSFGIEAQVISARPGPVITLFEIQPGEGVKGSKIAGVASDLARALGTTSLRIVMNLPGTNSMGLEIPSEVRQTVRISEILGSEEFSRMRSKLPLALGRDISGKPFAADLARMPHLLVAGTTGSGKSVGINAMILSILYRSSPDEVRFVMIDPKMVEFSPYEGIPNLLCQVVTDMSKAVNTLQWLTKEMNRRYAVMRLTGAKRLDVFNAKVKAAMNAGTPLADPLVGENGEARTLKPWPYIVVVVDELADLILAGSRREVEILITSLAQKARGAGIHLILATQRPSTDVVTPLIKANVPAHIAFQVVTRYDSQVIMGESGAEKLIGNGDMLYRVPGMHSMMRLQGCFVSDKDVEAVVAELKTRGEPDYMNEVMEDQSTGEDAGGGAGGEKDELYDKAVDIVLSTGRPTISSVQRHLSVGYNRAANLIEAMEKSGIVSSPDGAGKRQILVPTSRQ